VAGHPRIEIFDALCGALLVHLYEQFPRRIHLQFMDLRLEERLAPLEPAQIEEWMDLFVDTVSWLREEGFIRVETGTDDRDYYGVRLTMDGLAVLRAVPGSIQPSPQPLIERIKAALGSGGKIASEEGLRLAIGSIFSAAKFLG
jgi:hypothetical protein